MANIAEFVDKAKMQKKELRQKRKLDKNARNVNWANNAKDVSKTITPKTKLDNNANAKDEFGQYHQIRELGKKCKKKELGQRRKLDNKIRNEN